VSSVIWTTGGQVLGVGFDVRIVRQARAQYADHMLVYAHCLLTTRNGGMISRVYGVRCKYHF